MHDATETCVEHKICEMCGKTFFRQQGSQDKYCPAHGRYNTSHLPITKDNFGKVVSQYLQ